MTPNPLTRSVPAWVALMPLVVALIAAAAVIVPGEPAGNSAEPAGGPRREPVLVVGDSLTVASEGALIFNLRSLGYEPSIDARNGRRIADAVPILKRAKDAGTLPRRVVIALGTNDHSTSTGALNQAVNRVISTIGPSHDIVWVNAYLDTGRAPEYSGYDKVNRLLSKAAATNPAVEVSDWHGYAIRELPAGALTIDADGVHYPPPSTYQRAAFIAQALPPCRICSSFYRVTPSPSPARTTRS